MISMRFGRELTRSTRCPPPSRIAVRSWVSCALDYTSRPGVVVTCTHIDLQRHKSLYLCSKPLPCHSIDLRGRGDILKLILVGNATVGSVIVDALPSMVNFSHFVSYSVLKHLNFTIRDHEGTIANLYDHEISFTIELLRPSDQ